MIDRPSGRRRRLRRAGPVVFATLHFGSLVAVSTVLSDRIHVPITAPMETLDDPELQRILRAGPREHGGARTVALRDARRELRAALARGEAVGIVADRDIAGGGIPVSLFGLPASLPDRARLPRPRGRGAAPRRGHVAGARAEASAAGS